MIIPHNVAISMAVLVKPSRCFLALKPFLNKNIVKKEKIPRAPSKVATLPRKARLPIANKARTEKITDHKIKQ
jgi:hypothetical protein